MSGIANKVAAAAVRAKGEINSVAVPEILRVRMGRKPGLFLVAGDFILTRSRKPAKQSVPHFASTAALAPQLTGDCGV
jgi:hypothetical protein